jgi:amidase
MLQQYIGPQTLLARTTIFAMKTPNELTALQACAAISSGELSCEALVRSCLDRIAERNPEVNAFTAVRPDRAIEQARRVDQSTHAGVLRGIPFAVKDIFETAEFETAFGSPIYSGNLAKADAGCVAMATEQGGIAIGKVATGEFATQTPSKARNPLALEHTPGGSSSGSAAAVADYMVPVAFATQTTGSIVRPAVYCGAVGYKPSYDFIPRAGMKDLSPSQDTAGLITRTVPDAAFFAFGIHGARLALEPLARPRIAVCISRQWEHASAPAVDAIERFASRLARAGAIISRCELPLALEDMVDVQARIFGFEARRALAHERLHHWEQLSPRLRARLEGGRDVTLTEYLVLRQRATQARRLAASMFEDVDALCYPAAEGEAEMGLEFAGSPRFGAVWTLLHLPCVSFPIDTGPNGLPLGAQLIGPFAEDARLLAVAALAHKADS